MSELNMKTKEEEDCAWIIQRAKSLMKKDEHSSNSWFLIGRTLFPRNFSMQYEIYLLEKTRKSVTELARWFEDMLAVFPKEPLIWTEVQSMITAFLDEKQDEQSKHNRGIFNSLPREMQGKLLLRIADTKSTNINEQCRLLLGVVQKFSDQLPDNGIRIVEMIILSERRLNFPSAINVYRKCLVNDMLPILLQSSDKPNEDSNPTISFFWIQIAIEFFANIDAENSFAKNYFLSTSKSATCQAEQTLTNSLADIKTICTSINDPFKKLRHLIRLAANQYKWIIAKCLDDDCNYLQQFQILNEVHNTLMVSSSDTTPSTEFARRSLFLCLLTLFLQCMHSYLKVLDNVESNQGFDEVYQSAIVESCIIPNVDLKKDQRFKRQKLDEKSQQLLTVIVDNKAKLIENFLVSIKCWKLLHSKLLDKEFEQLCNSWGIQQKWPWYNQFEVDVCLYQGNYSDAAARLNHMLRLSAMSSSLQNIYKPAYNEKRNNIQMALCLYRLGKNSALFDLISQMILKNIDMECSTQPKNHINNNLTSRSRTSLLSTHFDPLIFPSLHNDISLQLLILKNSDLFSYNIELLLASFNRILKLGQQSHIHQMVSLDIIIGNMIVLTQHRWPCHENIAMELIEYIQRQGKLNYELFFDYIININILEEFANFLEKDDMPIYLNILPQANKLNSLSRSINKGMSKEYKFELKNTIKNQVSRSEENIDHLLITFLQKEKNSLLKSFIDC